MNNYNPFVNIDLRFPSAHFERVKSYCQTARDGGKPDPTQSPFPRYVDFWFLAVCLAAANKTGVPSEPAGGWQKFITGSEGLAADNWRVSYLELLAMAATDDERVVGDPSRVLDIANRYAAVGVPQVLDWLESGQSDPVDNVLDRLRQALRALDETDAN